MSVLSWCFNLFPGYPILWRSFFTTSLQFILGLPGLLPNPVTSQYSTCLGMRTSSILATWPSHRILLSRITFSRCICPVLFRTSLFVTLSLQVIPRIIIIIIITTTIFIVLSSTAPAICESSLHCGSSGPKSVSARWPPTRRPSWKLDLWVRL